MSRFASAGTNYIPVLDLDAAIPWYAEKFGLRPRTPNLAMAKADSFRGTVFRFRGSRGHFSWARGRIPG